MDEFIYTAYGPTLEVKQAHRKHEITLDNLLYTSKLVHSHYIVQREKSRAEN